MANEIKRPFHPLDEPHFKVPYVIRCGVNYGWSGGYCLKLLEEKVRIGTWS